MSEQAVYFNCEKFNFDLQKCLSPVPVVSNEVVRARNLNGNRYVSLQAALEGELRTLKALLTEGLKFKGKISLKNELISSYTGETGDYFYCLDDDIYYAWTGSAWTECGNAAKIANESVTPQKTTFLKGGPYPNLVTDNTVLRGKILNNAGSVDFGNDYATLQSGVKVTAGQTYSFSIRNAQVWIMKAVFKTSNDLTIPDNSNTYISSQVNVGYASIVAPEGAKYMFLSMAERDGDIAQLVVQQSESIQPVDSEIKLCDWVRVPHCLQSSLYGKTMMTLGDSLSEGGYWQSYVKSYLGLNKIIDLSVGGTKISQFTANVTAENIKNVDIVFVMGLFNSSSSVPGTVADAPSCNENASVCAGYKYIVETLYSLNPDAKIVLASPHRPQANDVAEKAKAVGTVAAYYGIPFIDLYNTAGFNSFTNAKYLRDSVHSSYGNGGGYQREAETIAGGLIHFFG